jgi:hypothetical protein
VCGEKNDCEKVLKYLVTETLNCEDWELEILPNSGGVGGALLSVLLCSVECFCLPCQMFNFNFTSSCVHVHQVFNALPVKFSITK